MAEIEQSTNIEVFTKTRELAKAKAKKAGISMKKYIHLAVVMAETNVELTKAK